MHKVQWKVYVASVAGRHHLDRATPCEDAACHEVLGEVLVGAVCDGAGSASRGLEGAQLLAQEVVAQLARAVAAAGWPPRHAQSAIHDAVAAARERLGAAAAQRGFALREFASTLVGCIAAPDGGCLFHVGDGYAVLVDDAGQSVLSRPENGEFADQTYFVTDDAWVEHLRVTPLAALRRGTLVGLMSDGTAPFAIDRARSGFYGPFIDPVLRYLVQADEQRGSLALRALLEDEKTHAITADDKTLLLALAG